MKFWSAEIKSGQSFDVKLGGRYLLIQHAAIDGISGEKPESALLEMIVDGEKHPLAKFKPKKRLQKSLSKAIDDKDFTICHNLKEGSVYLCGCISGKPIPLLGYDLRTILRRKEKEISNKEEEGSDSEVST